MDTWPVLRPQLIDSTAVMFAFMITDYCGCAKVLDNFSSQRSSLAAALSPLDMQLVDEVNEYLTLKGIRDWSLSMAHLKALCMLVCNMFLKFLVDFCTSWAQPNKWLISVKHTGVCVCTHLLVMHHHVINSNIFVQYHCVELYHVGCLNINFFQYIVMPF